MVCYLYLRCCTEVVCTYQERVFILYKMVISSREGNIYDSGDFSMDDELFQKRLLDLIDEIKRFPETKRESLKMLTGELGKKYEDLRISLSILQDTLDSLKLNVRYLFFDLEATKKENAALRKKLEEQGNNK